MNLLYLLIFIVCAILVSSCYSSGNKPNLIKQIDLPH